LDFKRSAGDAPNMIAFGRLIDTVHAALEGSKLGVRKFVHDDQREFGRFMRQWFPVLRGIDADSTGALSFMGDLRKIGVIRCDIELARSTETPGLQLIDIVLWLYRRSIADSLRGFLRCCELIEFVSDRAVVDRFTRAQLAEDAAQMIGELQSLPLSDEELARGREATKTMEQVRLQRMGLDLRRPG